jgi:2-oxoglutarate ferredoxin oxidoreductase subunit gamma
VTAEADRFEIRLSGAGGQGAMLAGKLLAAAAVYDGKNAVQTQSYGPEARGGKSKTDVVISNGEIDYPKATEVDVLLAMSQDALDEYLPSLKDGGTLIVDSYLVERVESEGAYEIPFTMLAIEECGRKLLAPSRNSRVSCSGRACARPFSNVFQRGRSSLTRRR